MKPKYIYILDIKLTGAKMTERLTLKVNYVWLTSLMNRPYYHNPGPVSRLQDPLQHEPVVGVHVHREQVKVCLHSELLEQLMQVWKSLEFEKKKENCKSFWAPAL